MAHTSWLKQTYRQPLYPDLVWSRPEQRSHAGKLLIIGGHTSGFSKVAEAYAAALKAGAGSVKVLLPDSLQKLLGNAFEGTEFAPSTKIGSFAASALAPALDLSSWADAVLVVGDLGRNSETAVFLEKFVIKYSGKLIVVNDAADNLIKLPSIIKKPPKQLFVLNFQQLQKFFSHLASPKSLTSNMGIVLFAELLKDFCIVNDLAIITNYNNDILVTVNNQVSLTSIDGLSDGWMTEIAAAAGSWWLQNPGKQFQAITTSLNFI
ncbi:MAG: hypothetical protein NVS1B10_00200 [Candidatus Saccharimonadales bacterium]